LSKNLLLLCEDWKSNNSSAANLNAIFVIFLSITLSDPLFLIMDPYWHYTHDIFNLLSIPVILTSNIYLLNNFNPYNLSVYIYIFVLYIFLDTLWLILKPQSVASPGTIIVHHIISIIGLVLTLQLDFHFAILGTFGGLIEFNTLFLILRRNLRYPIIGDILNILFYISWVVIRLIM
jgi:hypothetical protein